MLQSQILNKDLIVQYKEFGESKPCLSEKLLYRYYKDSVYMYIIIEDWSIKKNNIHIIFMSIVEIRYEGGSGDTPPPQNIMVHGVHL